MGVYRCGYFPYRGRRDWTYQLFESKEISKNENPPYVDGGARGIFHWRKKIKIRIKICKKSKRFRLTVRAESVIINSFMKRMKVNYGFI